MRRGHAAALAATGGGCLLFVLLACGAGLLALGRRATPTAAALRGDPWPECAAVRAFVRRARPHARDFEWESRRAYPGWGRTDVLVRYRDGGRRWRQAFQVTGDALTAFDPVPLD